LSAIDWSKSAFLGIDKNKALPEERTDL